MLISFKKLFKGYIFSVSKNSKFATVSSTDIYKFTCCELLNPVEFVSELFPVYIPDDVVKLLPEMRWKITWITKAQYQKITSIMQLYHKDMANFKHVNRLKVVIHCSYALCLTITIKRKTWNLDKNLEPPQV